MPTTNPPQPKYNDRCWIIGENSCDGKCDSHPPPKNPKNPLLRDGDVNIANVHPAIRREQSGVRMTRKFGHTGPIGQHCQQERTRRMRLVREGKASFWYPYRTLDQTVEISGIP